MTLAKSLAAFFGSLPLSATATPITEMRGGVLSRGRCVVLASDARGG